MCVSACVRSAHKLNVRWQREPGEVCWVRKLCKQGDCYGSRGQINAAVKVRCCAGWDLFCLLSFLLLGSCTVLSKSFMTWNAKRKYHGIVSNTGWEDMAEHTAVILKGTSFFLFWYEAIAASNVAKITWKTIKAGPLLHKLIPVLVFHTVCYAFLLKTLHYIQVLIFSFSRNILSLLHSNTLESTFF